MLVEKLYLQGACIYVCTKLFTSCIISYELYWTSKMNDVMFNMNVPSEIMAVFPSRMKHNPLT